MTALSLQLFGAPRLLKNDAALHLDTRKGVALLAYLAVERPYQSRDTLAALLWAEADHTSARGALRRTLSVLNTALDNRGLLVERDAVTFVASDWACDAVRLLQVIDFAASHSHSVHEVCAVCVEPLTHIVTSIRGEFLQGFSLKDSPDFDVWQSQQTERFRRLLSGALERLIVWYERKGTFDKALQLAQQLLALDVLHEPAHQCLIRLLALSGQRSAALAQYQECVRVLNSEIGVSPLEETTALYRAILENSLKSVSAPTSVTVKDDASPQVTGLVGRDHELHQLHTWAHQNTREQHLCIVSGESGIGKSALTQTFAQKVMTEGVEVCVVQCYASETALAYAPLVRFLRDKLEGSSWVTQLDTHWLEELTRVLPEIRRWHKNLRPLDATSPTRLYEALTQALRLVFSSGTIFVMEDAHWADSASLNTLTYVLRRWADNPWRVLLTWRTDSAPYMQQLRQLLTDYERSGGKAFLLALQRLERASLAQWVTTLDYEVDADQLYHESEGLPLFINALLARGKASTPNDLPSDIQQVLRSRLDSTSETVRQLLGAAAVIGRSFNVDILRECSGRSDEETVDGIEECLRSGLIHEAQTNGFYEFYHDKLREVVYHDTSLVRRRLLHRRAAQSLLNQTRTPTKIAALAAVIADHFLKGGQEAEAAEYFVIAGQHAQQVYAHREALAHFEMALALGSSQPKLVYQQCGDVQVLLGVYRAAIHSYEMALSYASLEDSPYLHQRLGRVYHRQGEWQLAESYYQTAYEVWHTQPSTMLATLLTDWSLTKMNRGQIEAAWDLAQNALQMANHANNPPFQAQAYNMLGILARKRGDTAQATEHLRTSLQIAQSLQDSRLVVATLNNLALNWVYAHDFADAQQAFEQALALCVQQGDIHHEAAIRNNLADVLHAVGQPTQALEQLKRAVSLFAQIGTGENHSQTEIWKLAEW
jgi:DNA-binding SARP family transcriptional activator/predicted ATPase